VIFVVIVGLVLLIEYVPDKDFSQRFHTLSLAIDSEAYEIAHMEYAKIRDTWGRKKFLYGLENSVERIEEIDLTLERLGFYLSSRDRTNALLETKLLAFHWRQLAE